MNIQWMFTKHISPVTTTCIISTDLVMFPGIPITYMIPDTPWAAAVIITNFIIYLGIYLQPIIPVTITSIPTTNNYINHVFPPKIIFFFFSIQILVHFHSLPLSHIRIITFSYIWTDINFSMIIIVYQLQILFIISQPLTPTHLMHFKLYKFFI